MRKRPPQLKMFEMSLSDRVADAISFLREHEPIEGYLLSFSGGKDSIVCKHLCRLSGVKFITAYGCTGIDPPELVRYIKKFHQDVVFCYPPTSFWDAIVKNGFPTIFARWCCNYLKKRPIEMKFPHLKNVVVGVRAEESFKRAGRPVIDKFDSQTRYKPIFYWKEFEIWEFIERYNLPYCSLYDEGYGRIGCVVCPFLCGPNQAKINRNKARWPGYFKAFEHAMKRLWDDRESKRQIEKGYSKTPEEFIDNWYHGK